MNSNSLRFLRQVLLTPRKLVGALVITTVISFLLLGPGEAEFVEHQIAWKARVAEEPLLWSALFFGTMSQLIGFSVPAASGMMLAGGFLFGRWHGFLLCHPAATLGAIQVMLLSRYLFQRAARRLIARQERIHHWVSVTDRGIEREGWYFLLLLRLTPIIPFFIVNLLMGLSRIRVWPYSWATAAGMVPTTFIFVNAGAAVSQIRRVSDLVSMETLVSLMLLVLIPVLLRILLPAIRTADSAQKTGAPI